MLERKRHNPGKQCWKAIWKNNKWKSKKVTEITEAQAGGIPGSVTADHRIALKQTIRELRQKGKNAYVIFLDVQKAYDKA